ncbi:MAG: FtsX-like permease family protein [Actinobacteria bacterium]|nr:FtsX-like permease family protein [Actinomycetota bacterium]
MLLAATLVASLVTLLEGMKGQASRQLEAYGANIILLPEAMSLPAGTGGLAMGEVVAEDYIDEQNLSLLESGRIEEVRSYAPYIYGIATYQGQKVVIVGTLFEGLKEIASYWNIEGEWVDVNEGEMGAILGGKVAQRFALHPDDEFTLSFREVSRRFKVTGIADVGGSEDNQIFVSLKTAQLLLGRPGQVDVVQIRSSTKKHPLSEIAVKLEKSLSGVKAKVISQIAEAEESVLFKVQILMVLITVLVLIASAVAVFSTLTTSVLDRRKEIGLLKALGARNNWIALIFLAEAWAIGLAGGVLGNVFGLGMAQAISKSVFDSYLSPQILAIPLTMIIAFVVATVAALVPVRKALSLEPIVTLRGE